MPAVQALYHLTGVTNFRLTPEEHLILEAEFFVRLCAEIMEIFRNQHKIYFRLIDFNGKSEDFMLDGNFIRLIIQDILSTDEYNLEGISFYTGVHVDVIYEIVSGINSSPSALLLRRVIELHRLVRPNLYRELVKKIAVEYLDVK